MSAKKNCQFNCCMECTPTLLNLHEQNLKLQQKYQQMVNINKSEIGSSTQMFTTIKKDNSRWIKPGVNRHQMGITQIESRSCNSTKDSIYHQGSFLNKQSIPEGCCYQKSLSIEGHKNNSKIYATERNTIINNQSNIEKSSPNSHFQLRNHSQSYCASTIDKKRNQDNQQFDNTSQEFEVLKQEINQVSSDSKQNYQVEQSHSSKKPQQYKNSSWEAFFGLKNINKSNQAQNIIELRNSPNLHQNITRKSNNNTLRYEDNNSFLTKREKDNNLYQNNEHTVSKSFLSVASNNNLHKGMQTNTSHDFTISSFSKSPIQKSPNELNTRSKIKGNQRSYTPQTKDYEQTTNRNIIQNQQIQYQPYTQNSQDLSYRQPLSNHNKNKSMIEEENLNNRSPYTPQQIKQNKIYQKNNQQNYSQSPLASADLTNDNKLSITQRSSIVPFPIHTTPILNNLISSNKKLYYQDNSVETLTQRNLQLNEIENINPNYLNVNPFMNNTNNEKQIKIKNQENISGKILKNQEFRGETSQNGYAFSQSEFSGNSNLRSEFRECKQILFNKYNLNDLQQINNDSYLLQSYKNNDQTGFFNDEILQNIAQSQTRSEILSLNKFSDQQAFSVVSNTKSIASSSISASSSSNHHIWYKMVSRIDDRYFSTFDGQTEFTIGKSMTKPFQQQKDGKVKGGITLHKNLENAFNTKFPQNSCLIQYPKAILKFTTSGNRIKIKDDCYVFQTIIPVEAIHLANE